MNVFKDSPHWNETQLKEFGKVMGEFQKYDNTAGFFVGNEVLTTGQNETTQTAGKTDAYSVMIQQAMAPWPPHTSKQPPEISKRTKNPNTTVKSQLATPQVIYLHPLPIISKA